MSGTIQETWPVSRKKALRLLTERAVGPYDKDKWWEIVDPLLWEDLEWLKLNGYICLTEKFGGRRYIPTPLADQAVDQGLLDD